MTDQSDTGNLTAGLDTDTVELTIKTLLSHLWRTLNWRVQFSRPLGDAGGACSARQGSRAP
eukprot:1180500-Prorocentrum_minimum.AAC.1